MNTVNFQIAVLRAKACARKSVERAVQLLIAAGAELLDAARFVLAVLRATRQGGAT